MPRPKSEKQTVHEDTPQITTSGGDGRTVIHFNGALDYRHAPALLRHADEVLDRCRGGQVVLDFAGAGGIDTTGLALVNELQAAAGARDIALEMENVPRAAAMFLSMARERHRETNPARPGLSWISRAGDRVLAALRDLGGFIAFLGDALLAFGRSLFRPRHWRFNELLYQVEKSGADAVLLVGGLTFLTGIIMALQTSSSFGSLIAPVYVADTVTLFTTKRMAPLLTAIIVAGRSGTGFASELGTMRVTNQIDALTVLGIDVTRFLVLPRVMALMAATPILIMIGNVAGLIGGALVGKWVMHVSFAAYFSEVRRSLETMAVLSGLIKGVVFGGLVGLIGCYRGLRVGHEAESVGTQTTAAVVNALLAIMLVDALFAAIFSLHGW